ncbi:hypothetical protein M422DRAFT_242682 [Sphaerobolus stellatus SS14]|nr:hypothetical protein M422DRAFT_242682 [Sphaerobolus stellatus SS14]
MPGGQPQKHFTCEEARAGRLLSKKAYREQNIDEEWCKSHERTHQAALCAKQAAIKTEKKANRKTVKRKLQIQQMAKQVAGNTSVDSTPQFEFGEKANLQTALRELLKQVFGNPEPPSCPIRYLESRHCEWISGCNVLGWELYKPEVKARDKELQLGNYKA